MPTKKQNVQIKGQIAIKLIKFANAKEVINEFEKKKKRLQVSLINYIKKHELQSKRLVVKFVDAKNIVASYKFILKKNIRKDLLLNYITEKIIDKCSSRKTLEYIEVESAKSKKVARG